MAYKLLRRADWFRWAVGRVLAHYLSFVWKTSRFVLDPPDLYARIESQLPVIIAMWHGNHFLVPFLRRPQDRVKALISFHHDADINAIAVERLGMSVIRGSGDHDGRFDRKGGVRAFIAMRKALKEGWNVALTADVPKVAKICGKGTVMLARDSGRLILPVAVTTSRRITLSNWDRTTINLPFSRGAMVLGEAVYVPPTADEDSLEACRTAVEASLNAATARANALVDAATETKRRA